MEEHRHHPTPHVEEMENGAVIQENGQEASPPHNNEPVLDNVADDNIPHERSRPTPPTLRIPPTEILARSSEIEQTHAPDSPTTMLITTLRDELMTLTDQSTVLNSKLIASLDRVANLEDTVYQKTSAEEHKDKLIQELERAKAQWEESMNTGLLVERKSVKEEMQRLVDGLVEEERRRGSAEEGRQRVENEVDDLSATLFEQANTMVAAERMARAQAETRLRQAEENLQAAEAAMRDMQHHLQSLPTLLPPADVGPSSAHAVVPARTYITTHVPYAEFIAFIQHIRLHKPRKPEHVALLPAPSLTTLLSQPFIARSQVEDIDPALRLEQAPDLSWLTRRSVTQAILAGELVIEPVSINTLKGCKEYASMHPADITCSMCGKPVVRKPVYEATENGEQVPPPKHPSTTRNNSTSRFSLKPFFSSPSASPSPSSSPAPATTPRSAPAPTTLFVFRVTTPSDSSTTTDASTSGRMYPLCASGWCLARLRAVCEWWRFVRISMIEVIWRGDDGYALAMSQQGQQRRVSTGLPASKRASVNGSTSVPVTPVHERNGIPGPNCSTEDVSQASSSSVTATNVEPEVASLPKKKSGWSLGFKNLGGGNKGLGLAASKSEPTTVQPAAVEKAELDKSIDFTPVDVTPVDITALTSSTTAPVTPLPANEPERSVSPSNAGQDTPRAAHLDDAEHDDKEEEEVRPRPASYADSQTSGENTNAFNTPESASAPLSPEQNVAENVNAPAMEHAPADASEGNALPATETSNVDISSSLPRSDDTTTAPADETRPSAPPTPTRPGRRAAPPPPPPSGQESPSIAPPAVPQRSRARPVSLTLNERNTHPSVSSPGKVENVAEEEETNKEEDHGKMDVTIVDASASGGFITPDPSAGSLATLVTPTPTRSATAHAPALPPRTSMEKRGSLQSPGIKVRDEVTTNGVIGGGAVQEEVDSWESKTWREVVRLKEEIWKARVGVSEES